MPRDDQVTWLATRLSEDTKFGVYGEDKIDRLKIAEENVCRASIAKLNYSEGQCDG